jgi:tetratricopeptide (TPR) repeat protein
MDDAFRAYDESYTDPRYVSGGPSRRSWTRWIVALVLVGAIAVIALTIGKQYADRFLPKQEEVAAAQNDDARVAEMLKLGAERLNAGDLEGAKEQFDKASVLAEKDPNVLSSLARLEATRADIHWLGLKLIPEDDETARGAEQKLLEARLEKVKRVTDRAQSAAANDPVVVRARIDAHRLAGEISKARALVSSLGGDASEPETAYVLAALDLAEPAPSWNTVIVRLRTAAAVEGDLGRARGALVYALVQAGRVGEARAELEKLQAAKHQSPLGDALAKLVDQAKPSEDAESDGEPEDEKKTESTDPTAAGEGAAGGPMDFRRLLEEAARAKGRGDLSRAEMYYRQARDKQPGNVEALAGLGDVAMSRGDTASAARFYDSVLASNPSYLPAIMARADLKWGSGDRPGAVTLYRRAVQQSGPGTAYGARAQARINELESSSKGSTETPEAPSEPAAPREPDVPAPTPPSEPDKPEIDTTDLPGFH